MTLPVAELALDARAQLGEAPLWDPRDGLLHWADVSAGTWHRFDPAGGGAVLAPRRLGERLSSLAPRRDGGGHVAAVDGAVHLLDAAGRSERTIPLLEPDGDLVLNDGACDRAGRYWIGSASRAGRPDAALHRIAPDGTHAVARTRIAMSNGLGWSPDGRTFLHVDSGPRRLTASRVDPATGDLGDPPRPLAELAAGDGIPDGLAVDEHGAIWLAVWGAGEVRRIAPDGRVLARVRVPATQVTSCAFGGPALDQLWITTAREGLDPAALARQPLAGGLFVADPGVRGLPAHAFAG